jgi:hypothetical protein
VSTGSHWSIEDEERLIAWKKSHVSYEEMSRRLGGARSACACESKVRELRMRGRGGLEKPKRHRMDVFSPRFEEPEPAQWPGYHQDLYQLWERANAALRNQA